MSIIDDTVSKARIAAIRGRGAIGNQIGSWLRAAAGNTMSDGDSGESRTAKIIRAQRDRIINTGLNMVSFGSAGTAKAILDKTASILGVSRLSIYLSSLGLVGIACGLLVFGALAPWVSVLQMLGVFPTTDDLQVAIDRCDAQATSANDLTCEQQIWREQCEEYKTDGRWPADTDCNAILNSLNQSSSSQSTSSRSSSTSTSSTTSSNSNSSTSSSSSAGPQ